MKGMTETQRFVVVPPHHVKTADEVARENFLAESGYKPQNLGITRRITDDARKKIEESEVARLAGVGLN